MATADLFACVGIISALVSAVCWLGFVLTLP